MIQYILDTDHISLSTWLSFHFTKNQLSSKGAIVRHYY